MSEIKRMLRDFERQDSLRAAKENLRNELTATQKKLDKLKALILLTDPVVSNVEMNKLSAKQWAEFIREFPDESIESYRAGGE